ncbi:MAG: hypothetical protein ACPGUD_01445 [Parashewanella sp.]
MDIKRDNLLAQMVTKHGVVKPAINQSGYILTLSGKPPFYIKFNKEGELSTVSYHDARAFKALCAKLSLFFQYGEVHQVRKAVASIGEAESTFEKVVHFRAKQDSKQAKLIEQKCKAFLRMKQQLPISRYGLKEAQSPITGARYYFDPEGKVPHVRMPELPVISGSSGGFKQLMGKDNHFVALAAKSVRTMTAGEIRNRRLLLQKLSQYPSVCRVQQVNSSVQIAIDGGKDVSSFIGAGKQFKIAQFKQACTDLSEMHKAGIILGDIKPRNMVAKSANAKVRFIDVDDAQWSKLNDKLVVGGKVHTNKYLTVKFIQRFGEHNPHLAKQLDNYCLLQTMCAATDKELAREVSSANGTKKLGICNKKNGYLFKIWCITNVKPEFQQDIINFLCDPVQYPLTTDLASMLNWSS